MDEAVDLAVRAKAKRLFLFHHDPAHNDEKIDQMVNQILQATSGDLVIAMTGDHSTPVTVGDHSGEPCPIFFWGHGVRPDACTAFGERSVLGGGVGRIRGLDVMNIMTSYMGFSCR